MRPAREVQLANDFFRLWEEKSTSLAAKSRSQPTSVYTDRNYLAEERRKLFRGRPLYFCLSGELSEPGDYVCADLDGLPVVVIRGEDERLRALVNACLHRGARIFTGERGHVSGRGVSCPFHSWTYDVYGRLLGQPLARDGFNDCDANMLSLRSLEVVERHGVVLVTPVSADDDVAALDDIGSPFGAADDDIRDLHLADCRFVDSSTRVIGLNWKLVIDTFLEAYHVFALHRTTLATRQLSAPCLFEDLGPMGLVIGVRKTVLEEQDKDPSAREFSPHATLQYITYPNVIISHQIDHIETWRVFPGERPDEAIVTTSIYSYGDDVDERTMRYLHRSIEVLLAVTDQEDFPQVVRTQRALNAGALSHFTFGRNEPGLIAYHEWLDEAMCAP